jgi:MFS family permease
MQPTTKTHLRASIRDGLWTNLSVGLGENYFTAFLLAMGFSGVASGIGAIIPLFLGTTLQLFSLHPFFRRKPLKKRIQFFLLVQAFSFFPLILLGWSESTSLITYFAVLTLYWASSQSLLPSWNLLMAHTVPLRFRLKFFSLRLQFAQASVVVGLLTAGIGLHWATNQGQEKNFYLLILAVCLLLKLLSWNEFRFHREHKIEAQDEQIVSLKDLWQRLWTTEQGKLIRYLFIFYFSIHTSAAFYNPYMLQTLKFNYLEFMGIISISFFGRIMMSRWLNRWAQNKHVGAIFLFSCLGIASTPIWWVSSQYYWWIIAIEFLSGCYWAGFDLSTTLLYFDQIKDKERTSLMSYIYFFNTLGMGVGTLVGGWLLAHWPFEGSNYLGLFILSSFVRFAVILMEPKFDFRGKTSRWWRDLKRRA